MPCCSTNTTAFTKLLAPADAAARAGAAALAPLRGRLAQALVTLLKINTGNSTYYPPRRPGAPVVRKHPRDCWTSRRSLTSNGRTGEGHLRAR